MGSGNGMGIKFEIGKLYVTRNGKKVRILATDLQRGSHTVAAVVTEKSEDYLTSFTAAGHFGSTSSTSDWDIVGPWVEPKRKKVVYEWMYQANQGDQWKLSIILTDEKEAARLFTPWPYKKTGRQFEVEE